MKWACRSLEDGNGRFRSRRLRATAAHDTSQGTRAPHRRTESSAREVTLDYTRDTDPVETQEWLDSLDGVMHGARQTARGFAETNVNAAFDFAQQLVRAKDPKEIVRLQQEFLRRRVEQMSRQMKERGEHATQTAQSAGAAARPRRS